MLVHNSYGLRFPSSPFTDRRMRVVAVWSGTLASSSRWSMAKPGGTRANIASRITLQRPAPSVSVAINASGFVSAKNVLSVV